MIKEEIDKIFEEQMKVWQNYSKQGTIEWTWEIAAQDLQYQMGSLTKRILQHLLLNVNLLMHERSLLKLI